MTADLIACIRTSPYERLSRINELATALWKEAGSPPGRRAEFAAEAERRLIPAPEENSREEEDKAK
ncbi:Protein of unknown function (DUF2934) [Opitutaceae bacterium TAV1]|nr:hypothetical protein OPIT5_05645 [Opitutaceae bacterium TAV5]EIP99702.1 Protein of unknown function (DUF2934) [Opitutaceae bacterium TAV1]